MNLIAHRCPHSLEQLRVLADGEMDQIRGKIDPLNMGGEAPIKWEGLMVNKSGSMAYPISRGIPRILKALAISLDVAKTGEIR